MKKSLLFAMLLLTGSNVFSYYVYIRNNTDTDFIAKITYGGGCTEDKNVAVPKNNTTKKFIYACCGPHVFVTPNNNEGSFKGLSSKDQDTNGCGSKYFEIKPFAGDFTFEEVESV